MEIYEVFANASAGLAFVTEVYYNLELLSLHHYKLSPSSFVYILCQVFSPNQTFSKTGTSSDS